MPTVLPGTRDSTDRGRTSTNSCYETNFTCPLCCQVHEIQRTVAGQVQTVATGETSPQTETYLFMSSEDGGETQTDLPRPPAGVNSVEN